MVAVKRSGATPAPILRYPGGKFRQAEWIVARFPPHRVYVEPYFGGGSVFFRKSPVSVETVNDRDGDVVNLFSVIRSRPEELAAAVSCTPYARAEYESAYQSLSIDPVESARCFLVKCWQGIGSSLCYRNGWRRGTAPTASNMPKLFARLPDNILLAAQRLKMAQIENRPALELIGKHSDPDTLIYLDPPYLPDTRKKYLYRHEMTLAEHEQLLCAIVRNKSKIMISGYESELYNDYLQGWKKEKTKARADFANIRTETIWYNY